MSALAGQAWRATQRARLSFEMAQASEEPTGEASTSYTTRAGVTLMPTSWLGVGAEFPWVWVDSHDAGTTSGYGDTALAVSVTPLLDPSDTNVYTFALRGSLPTRTYRLTPDPGKQYSVAPSFVFTQHFERTFWQALLKSSAESRPAGVAWEAGGGLSLGYVLPQGIGFMTGLWMDTRLGSLCAAPAGDLEYCRRGRVTERQRGAGVTRGYLMAYAMYQLGAFGISAGAHLPLTRRRDFDILADFGVELVF